MLYDRRVAELMIDVTRELHPPCSTEFAVLLPWFRDLFSLEEQAEAERRLILHDFPLERRLSARAPIPPEWASAR